MEAIGNYRIACEARVVRSATFSGIFSIHEANSQPCDPPVVIIVPGQWTTPEDARRAAREHAAVMAEDDALQAAIAVRTALLA